MNRFWKALARLALPVMLAVFASGVLAQATELQSIDLGDGFTISVPADWRVKPANEGVFSLRGETLSLIVTTQTRLDALNISTSDNLTDALAELALNFNGVSVQRSVVKQMDVTGGQAAIYKDLTNASLDLEYAVVKLGDGRLGYLAFSAAKGEMATQQDVIAGIIASFGDGSAASAGGSSVSSSGGDSSSSGAVSCTVSSDSANSAQLRVGPGPNRGAIGFLPANTPVTVTGRIVLDDGSVWYQLDKATAAPNGTAAAELWVAAESVNASGDCDHVGETSAPPIIHAVAPPAPSDTGSGSAPSDTGSGSAPSDTGSAPGTVPAPGTWTLTLNATTNASCTGYQNVPFNSSELFDTLTYTYRVVGISANSFRFNNDVYTRVGGTTTFTGMLTFDDGTQGQAWLNVIASSSINGQVIENFTLDNTACSGTILFLATHN